MFIVRVNVTKKFLDFKTIKKFVEEDKNMFAVYLKHTQDATAEKMVKWWRTRIKSILKANGYGRRKVTIYLQETSKYGVDIGE